MKPELRDWLIAYLRKRGMNQHAYSVAVCRTCGHRSLWSPCKDEPRVTHCQRCGIEQILDFHQIDLRIDKPEA